MTEEDRKTIDFDSPRQLETALLVEHVKTLKSGTKEAVMIPEYNFKSHSREKDWKAVIPSRIILVEGILIFDDQELVKLMDFKLFIDTDDDIRFIRRMTRDIKERQRTVEEVVDQYQKTVRPAYKVAS